MHENREIPQAPVDVAGRSWKACGRTRDAYACGKSDIVIVPMTTPNKGNQQPEEADEERTMTKGNSKQCSGDQAQNWTNPLLGLGRIREAARRDRGQRFTSLMHHLSPQLLRESFYGLRKDAAAGVG